MNRRSFLKWLLVGVAALTGGAGSVEAYRFIFPAQKAKSWPITRVGNISSLSTLRPITFNYPCSTGTPNILVKLGTPAHNGVGPDKDIVAFSSLCQHLGCTLEFVPQGQATPLGSQDIAQVSEGFCPCHPSVFDFVNAGNVISGQSKYPLPQVILKYDEPTGDLYATALTPPNIFGRGPSGTMDLNLVMNYDLAGC